MGELSWGCVSVRSAARGVSAVVPQRSSRQTRRGQSCSRWTAEACAVGVVPAPRFHLFSRRGIETARRIRITYAEKEVGVTLYRVKWVAIEDLTVQGFQRDGINAFNSDVQVSLIRLTCRGNGRSGITVGGASLVDIDTCLIGDNGKANFGPCLGPRLTSAAVSFFPIRPPPGWMGVVEYFSTVNQSTVAWRRPNRFFPVGALSLGASNRISWHATCSFLLQPVGRE